MYYDQPLNKDMWAVDHQFMYGGDILVCPKITQKFLMPNQTVRAETSSFVYEFTNSHSEPLYEVLPQLPDYFFDWNTKKLL